MLDVNAPGRVRPGLELFLRAVAPPKFPEGLRTELLVVGAASGARLHRLHCAAPVGEELVPDGVEGL